MANPLPTLDDLIAHVRRLDPATELDRVAAAIDLGARGNELSDHLIGYFIDEARRSGVSWSAIGERLGLSRQAVQKRYAPAESDAGPARSPGFFDRMVPAGKHVIVSAQEQARRRRSDYIGTEHLLLGLTAEPDDTGARALAECGAPPEVITGAVNGRIGVPDGEPRTDKLPFTRTGKAVLEHALREAVRLDHDFVGTGHLALACLTVQDGLASEVLRNLGVGYDALREAVVGLTAPQPQPAG
jgi:Clp amino terminal domain, pathogenicity island component